MSCLTCCQNPLFACPLACSDVVLNLGIAAPSNGTYTAQTLQFGQVLSFQTDRLAGQNLSFALSGLNEQKQFDFTILDPSGNLLTLVDSLGNTYDCVRLETHPNGAGTVTLQIP